MIITFLILGMCVLLAGLLYLTYTTLSYRNLCVKLTKVVKDMHCEVEGCNNYRYNTAPIDDTKGYMDKMCSLHMAERIEEQNGQSGG